MGTIGKRDNNQSQFWADSRDFTPAYDRLMLEFNEKIADIVEWLNAQGKLWDQKADLVKRTALILEPYLQGGPPLFPDASLEVDAYYHHEDLPVRVTNEAGGVPEREPFYFGCSRMWCWRRERLTVERAYPEINWSLGIKERQENKERLEQERKEWLEGVKNITRYWANPCGGEHRELIFELKPQIDSLGSTLRQLRLYKERRRADNALVCLVTPETAYDAVFEEQGFPVVHLETNGV